MYKRQHLDGGSVAKHGAYLAATGQFKNNARRIAANRAAAQKKTSLTPEIISMIITSDKSGTALARELGFAQQVVSAVRTGKITCFQPVGGVFSQLLR